MSTPGRGSLRLGRGLALALGSLALPMLGHVAAGGGTPDPGPFVLVAMAFAGLCVAIADRRRSVLEIGAVVLLSQPVLHVLFTLSTHADESAGLPSPSMVGAHVGAGLVLTVLLAGAEASLWAVYALLRRVVPTVPGRAAAPYARSSVVATDEGDLTPPVSRMLRHCLGRRGPPVFVAA